MSANLTVAPIASESNCSHTALLAVRLDAHGRGYVDKAGGLTIETRIRAHGGCSEERSLAAATVTGDIGAHTVSVNSHTDTVTLHLLSAPARGPHSFEVQATFKTQA